MATDKENLLDDITGIIQVELCEVGTRATLEDGTSVRVWMNEAVKRALDQVKIIFDDEQLKIIRLVPYATAQTGDIVGINMLRNIDGDRIRCDEPCQCCREACQHGCGCGQVENEED